jgi:hypothetical protein
LHLTTGPEVRVEQGTVVVMLFRCRKMQMTGAYLVYIIFLSHRWQHARISHTQEAGLHSKTLSQKKEQKKEFSLT